MIDEQEWKCVLQVVRDGTFSQAAKSLYMSQPALSQCIRKIEEELGEELFKKGSAHLTKAGELYVRKAKEVERLQKELVTGITEGRALRGGRLTIGSSPECYECYLLAPLVRFQAQYPGVRLSVKKAPADKLREALRRGEVDFALLYAPLAEETLKAEPLLKEQVLLAVPPGHRLTKGMSSQPMPLPRVSFKELAGEPFIATKKLGRELEGLASQTGSRPEVVFEAESLTDAVQLASAGMGITLVTDMLLYHLPLAKTPIFFELKEEVAERELAAVYKEKLSVAAQRFLGLLGEQG